MKALKRALCCAVALTATFLVAAAPVAAQAPVAAAGASTLDAIRSRGMLVCGVNTGLVGFAQSNNQGDWRGFDVDYCRAVAAAIFGDPGKVHFVPTTTQSRFAAIESGVVDILSRNTTWTLTRDSSLRLDFVATNFYDGQGFMVPATSRVRAARELDGATICVEPGTTTEQNLADWARASRIRITPMVIEGLEASVAAYLAGRCDAYTTDVSALSAIRAGQPHPAAHVILPNVISKEPLAIVVRQGDQRFGNLIRWTHYLLVAAEEASITQANVQQMQQTDARPDVQRMLGRSGGLGPMLGLTDRWAVDVLLAVGNYGEIFARNLAPIGIQRGPNALWTTLGGLQYSPPFR